MIEIPPDVGGPAEADTWEKEPTPAPPAAPDPSTVPEPTAGATGQWDNLPRNPALAVPSEGEPSSAQPEAPPLDARDADPAALQRFHDRLDTWGYWVDDPVWGTVWVPDSTWVEPGFVPFVTGGYWVRGGGGVWIWQSPHPFGFVTYRYGRWVRSDLYGWVWIAGGRWAPNWVTWRTSGYDGVWVGWAPLPPSFIWVHGAPVALVAPVPPRYVFCPRNHVLDPRFRSHLVRDPGCDALRRTCDVARRIPPR